MTKKKLWIIVCACVVLVAIIGITIFLVVTKDVDGNPNGNPDLLTGTWQVISHNSDPLNPDSKFALIEGQYIVFKEGKISYYAGGNLMLSGDYSFASKKLTIKNVETKIEGFPEEFAVEQIAGSENYIKLIDEVKIRDWQLIRNAGDGVTPSYVDQSAINGKWNVYLHGASLVSNEQIVFDTQKSTMADYRNGSKFAEVNYVWDSESRANFTGFGVLYMCNVSENCIVLIQLEDNGNVWELHRAQ